jgi:hypothetical protein
MEPYKNSGNLSWISAFEIGDDYIKIQFIDGVIHLYTNSSAGGKHIQKMKELAIAGKGLHSYIDKHVKKMYANIYNV